MSSRYENTPFNYLAFKASHNSYDQGVDLETQLGFDPADPSRDGCRGLELDLVQVDNGNEWEVRHVAGWRPPLGDPRRGNDLTRLLSGWLQELRRWCDARPGHDPVVVVLDLKTVDFRITTFPADFDRYLRAAGFDDDNLFTPADLVLLNWCWPTLGEMRGHCVFVLSGAEGIKSEYAKSDNPLCFADRSIGRGITKCPDFKKDPRVFVNIDCNGRFETTLDWCRRSTAMFVRVYYVNDERSWRQVRKAGANMLATDFLLGANWARIDGSAAAEVWTRVPGTPDSHS
jgi:hypothetical protein